MVDDDKASVITRLREIPGVGENAAEGLYKLGVRDVKDLDGRSAEQMYEELRNMKGYYAEPCMLNSFKIATKFAVSKK
jgi:hypothetical protein